MAESPAHVAIDEVVPDDPARVVVGRPLDQPERDLALAIDERVAVDQRVGRRVPHQDRRARELTLRRAHVPEQVVPDDPVVAGVDVHAVRVVVAAGRVELDHRVLDDAVVHAAARAVRAGLDVLLSGVHQPHVVDERRLRPGVQHDRVEIDVANRQARDRDAAHVAADPDPERHAAVARGIHPFPDQHDVVAVSSVAADADVREGAVDVERGGQVVGAGRDQDRRVGGDGGHRVLELRHGGDAHDRAGRRRQRRRRHGRTGHGGAGGQHEPDQQERRANRRRFTLHYCDHFREQGVCQRWLFCCDASGRCAPPDLCAISQFSPQAGLKACPRSNAGLSKQLAHRVELLRSADVSIQHAGRIGARAETEVHDPHVLADHLSQPGAGSAPRPRETAPCSPDPSAPGKPPPGDCRGGS